MPWPSDSEHPTLTASVVTTVTLDQSYNFVVVKNHGTDVVYYNVDAGATDPTVAGAGSAAVLGSETVIADAPGNGATQVKLISSGTPTVSVEAGER